MTKDCICRNCLHYDNYLFRTGGICMCHECDTQEHLTCCDYVYNYHLDK